MSEKFSSEKANESTTDELLEGLEKSSGSAKFKILAFLGILSVGGGGGALYFTGIFDDPTEVEQAEPVPLELSAPPIELYYYDFPPMVTNLSSNSSRPGFLKFSVSLEVNDVMILSRIQQLEPRIIDIFQTYLRELRIDDLREPQSIPNLRQEILAQVNAAILPAEVSGVLLKEILIQ